MFWSDLFGGIWRVLQKHCCFIRRRIISSDQSDQRMHPTISNYCIEHLFQTWSKCTGIVLLILNDVNLIVAYFFSFSEEWYEFAEQAVRYTASQVLAQQHVTTSCYGRFHISKFKWTGKEQKMRAHVFFLPIHAIAWTNLLSSSGVKWSRPTGWK